MKKLLAVVAVLGLFGGLSSLYAQDGGEKEEKKGKRDGERKKMSCDEKWAKMLEHKDKNSDGKISADEMGEGEEFMKKIDGNSDGSIDKDEFIKFCESHHGKEGKGKGDGEHKKMSCAERWEKMLEHKDKDGDGKISKDEGGERMAKGFDKIDKDGNGSIDKDEFISFCESHHDKERKKDGEGKDGEKKDEKKE